MKKPVFFLLFLLICLFAALLVGCGTVGTFLGKDVIKVGVTTGPHAEIMQIVKKSAENNGLHVVIVEFNDYTQPNEALRRGDIDINSFQSQPYLDAMIKDRKYEFMSVAKTVIFPMGIYSKKITNLADLGQGSIVVIPNDPANSSRSLSLLEKSGLLVLNPSAGYHAAVADIVHNPRGLLIKEVDAAQVFRSLDSADIAVINANFAVSAGLVPAKDALLLEAADSPYANVLVIRAQDKEKPVIQKFVHAYHSEEVKLFVQDHFKGVMATAW